MMKPEFKGGLALYHYYAVQNCFQGSDLFYNAPHKADDNEYWSLKITKSNK